MARRCWEGVGERRRMPAMRVRVWGVILCSVFWVLVIVVLRYEV